ncbi:unnamed protein product [Thelazia callipaeda]|uniref:Uncharacterized protein n=1 Tax=Thelazia callipaeda TaxID=103827 RepID=A0A0N5CT70_THECL|nr:unnamed protein product [Thelazia callipaeda]
MDEELHHWETPSSIVCEAWKSEKTWILSAAGTFSIVMMNMERFSSTIKEGRGKRLSSDESKEFEMRRKPGNRIRCALQQHEWDLKKHTRGTVIKCLGVLSQHHIMLEVLET